MNTLSSWIIDLVVWANGGWVSSAYFQESEIPWWGIVSGLLMLISCFSATLVLLAMAFQGMKCHSAETAESTSFCDNCTHTL